MKPSRFTLPLAALAAACLAGLPLTPVSAQTTATTTPVGFVTISVAGAPSGSYSFAGLSVSPPVAAQGTSTAVGTNTITDTTQTWTQDQFDGAAGPYYVEITGPTSGAGIGTTYDITATNASTQTITLAQSLASGVAAGATYRIRAHWTIASVFGATNTSGLQGGNSQSADKILLYNPTATPPAYSLYYYKTTGTSTGWRVVGDNTTDQSQTILYPEQGILFNCNQSANINITLMGAVKIGQTSVPVVNGYNVIGNVYAAPMTLGTCNLYTGSTVNGIAGGNSQSADKVYIYNTSSTPASYQIYYYKTTGTSTGWRVVGDNTTDQSGVQLPVSGGFLVQTNGTGFNWVIPQFPTSL